MTIESISPLGEREAAIVALLERPDPPDLPPRRHARIIEGDPEGQDRLRQYLPVAFVQRHKIERRGWK
jgi:hypothetical protein